MTLRRLIFRDFWRKLVALIFAVIIYWQVSESIKRNGAGTKLYARVKPQVTCERVFTVRMLSRGVSGRHVIFASDPKISVKFRGAKEEVAAVRNDDLLFYVDVDELRAGQSVLPVRWQIGRPGVEVVSVSPAELNISIAELTVNNH